MEFVSRLFDTSDFPARWSCGRWSPGLGWMHVLSDLGVWSAYFAIPVVLAYFLARRKDLPFRSIFLLFAAFIVLCGTTHLMDAIIFWWPAYRLAGLIKLLTASVSWFTVFALIQVAPFILTMPFPEQLNREILARRQAEEELRQANERLERRVEERTRELAAAVADLRAERELLRTTLASIGDAVMVTDTEGAVTMMNPVAEALTGWSTAEGVGRPLADVFEIVNEKTREPVENPVTRVLREGIVVGLANHTVLISKAGGERPIDDSAAPIRRKDGEIAGCVLIFRDVTERNQREKLLAESERQFRTLAESIPQLCWMAKPDGHIFWYNRRWYDYTGTTPEAMEGWGWRSVHDPDVLPKVMERWRTSIATGTPFDMVFPIKGADGVFRPFLTRIVPVRDDQGRIVRWFGTNTDVTESERVKSALRESEARFTVALRNARIVVYTTDADLRYTWIHNPRPLFRSDEVLGRRDDELFPVEQAEPLLRIKREVFETGVGRRAEFVAERDGEEVVYDLTVEPLRDRGECVGVTVAAMEITERKKIEGELRRLTAELSEADRRKDEFLATLAHELRNPLAPIRNGLHVMKLARDDAEAVERSRTMMERQLEQMVRLVDDLMDVSRITRGKVELRKRRVRLATVVNSAVETCRPLIDQMGHDLSVEMPKEHIVVDADLTRLAQVFMNLLNNAAKYGERGGSIRLKVEPLANEVLVTVKDSGIGIDADHLLRIFDLFTQVDRSLEKAQGGLGIGLTLVKRLVEMHGGSVEARSEGLGLGSEFAVRLPIVDEPPPAPPKEQAGVEGKSSFRILIVDDNADGAESLARMLNFLGNETRTAHDGRQGVERAEEYRPDVALIDIGLPILNGYEACRRIREQPWGRSMILIAVTGWGQEEDRRRSQEAGFDRHMIKPVDPKELMKLLAELSAARR